MAEPGALLLVPIDAFLLESISMNGQHVPAGQQRGAAGQLRQQQSAYLLQLQHVADDPRCARLGGWGGVVRDAFVLACGRANGVPDLRLQLFISRNISQHHPHDGNRSAETVLPARV
jgi:hypothetical protein